MSTFSSRKRTTPLGRRCPSAPALVTGVALVAMGCGASSPPPAAAPGEAQGDDHDHSHEHAHDDHTHEHAHGDHAHGGDDQGHGPLVHRFEHAQDWVAAFDDPARDAWQHPKEVVDAMDVQPGMTVADLGAGTGYFEPWLSRAVGDAGTVLALDVEPDMVRYLTERAAREHLAVVRAAVVAMDDPKLPAAGVDRVLVVDTWHHIADREAYAAKLRSGLKPGGKVFIVDFKLDAKHGPPPQHRLAAEQVVRELGAGGLTASVAPTSLPEQFIVVGARP